MVWSSGGTFLFLDLDNNEFNLSHGAIYVGVRLLRSKLRLVASFISFGFCWAVWNLFFSKQNSNETNTWYVLLLCGAFIYEQVNEFNYYRIILIKDFKQQIHRISKPYNRFLMLSRFHVTRISVFRNRRGFQIWF